MPSGVSRQQMACIHYASTLSCMPSTKGIPLRLLSIHRSLACHCPVTRDTQRQTPCISYLSHAFHYSLRDLSASDKQRHTLCVRSLSHAVSCPRVRLSLACCMAPRSHHRHALCLPSAALSLDCIAASFQIFSPLNRHPSLHDTGFGHMTLASASDNTWDSIEPCNGFVTRLVLVLSTCL